VEALRQQVGVLEPAEDEALVGQDELPHHGTDHEGHEERDQQHQQEEILLAPAVERDPVGDGERDHQVDDRGRAREPDTGQELGVVQAELLAELGPVPGHDARPGAEVAALQGQREHHDQRHQEQHQQPQPRGQAQQVRRERLAGPDPRVVAHAPWVIGKNRLFHAVSSS
jgi:hypothetical protein